MSRLCKNQSGHKRNIPKKLIWAGNLYKANVSLHMGHYEGVLDDVLLSSSVTLKKNHLPWCLFPEGVYLFQSGHHQIDIVLSDFNTICLENLYLWWFEDEVWWFWRSWHMFKVILKPFNNLPLGPVWEASAFIMCFSLVSFNLSPICTFPSGCETEWAWRRFYSCLHHRAITSYVFEQRLGRLISLHLFTSTLMRAYRNSLMHLMTCSGSSVGLRLPPFLACYCKFYSAPPPLLSHYGSV